MASDHGDERVWVRASVRILGPDEGGRTTPLRGGSYRPLHDFFGDGRELTAGFIEIPEGDEVQPGETIETTIAFGAFPRLREHIRPGCEWRLQEGPRLVGIGKVLEVLP